MKDEFYILIFVIFFVLFCIVFIHYRNKAREELSSMKYIVDCMSGIPKNVRQQYREKAEDICKDSHNYQNE